MILSVNSTILYGSPETVQNIVKCFDLDKPGKMDEAIAMFEDWIKMQRHFKKKNYNRNFLEMLIIQNKGSLERAKSRLDKYCTLRTLMPKYYEKVNAKTEFQDMKPAICPVVLPQYVGDYERVAFVKVFNTSFSFGIIMDFYRMVLIMADFVMAHDYFLGAHLVVDFQDASIADLLVVLNPIELGEALKLTLECFGFRLKSIHFVTSSVLVQGVVTMFRQVVSKKIGERVHVHKNFESLFQFLPRDNFPEEYGGREKCLLDMRDEWIEALASDQYVKYVQEMKNATTDEQLRDKYEFNSKYMGVPGTFKSLTVD